MKTFVVSLALIALLALGMNQQDAPPQRGASVPPVAALAVADATADESAPPDNFEESAAQPITRRARSFDAFLYAPASAHGAGSLQVVIALHGIGGDGRGFAAPLIKAADRYGWLVVAPTLQYRDWRDPAIVAEEEANNCQRLLSTIEGLPALTGLNLKPKIDLFGFSRGAQFAHRFAILYPERVARAAVVAAGSYTLPYRAMDVQGDGQRVKVGFPYGVGDMSKIGGRPINRTRLRDVLFWVGVGSADNAAADVPRAWDPYVGRTRVERAREFVNALQGTGVQTTLQVYAGAGHELTPPDGQTGAGVSCR
ncbi:MAG: hypothetical protein HY259_00600 [Chloroflexi bacterium]|nr:hypothetical protein [Chloroflexota bacterium]